MFRNGSGYADPTAYKALSNIERDGKMDFNRGEIFEYEEVNKGKYRKALILSADFRANDRIQSIILLNEEPKGDHPVPIVCEGMMYADCSMVSFARNDRLGRFCRKATQEEMDRIDEGVAKCLGIEETVQTHKYYYPGEPVPQEPIHDNAEELVTAKAEAKVYKDLYENLLAKVMG